jgi:hypothetical protein
MEWDGSWSLSKVTSDFICKSACWIMDGTQRQISTVGRNAYYQFNCRVSVTVDSSSMDGSGEGRKQTPR